jgi:hypothetical protein
MLLRNRLLMKLGGPVITGSSSYSMALGERLKIKAIRILALIGDGLIDTQWIL